jgi:ABC-type multidrug transport system fused ATPase/permease subunit
VYAFNLQDYFLGLYMNNSAALTARAKDQSYESSMLYGLQILSFFYAIAFTFWYGAWLVKEQSMSYEDVIVTVFVQFMSCLGVSVASAVASDLTSGKAAIKGVFNTIDKQPFIDSYGRTGETPALSGKLSFVNVVFRYPNRDFPVLQSINFTLQPGKSLGICGSTGSGKSTLAAMMLRLYDPESGAVHFDSFDLKDLNVRHLRSFVGWVPQEAVLFEGDLRFNLKLSKPDATDEEIIEALRAAQALTFIQEKGGLDAAVAFRGQNFSGGQKQRLALARGFLRKPALMILDEGTSALDSISEGLVLEEVRQLRCSVVNIAHRLQTIQHCDHIIVLEQGSILEEGSHEELTKKQGVYYDLIRSGY